MIEAEKARFPVHLMCRVLDVSRREYYAWRASDTSMHAQQDEALGERIAAIHARSRETYGNPRVLDELQADGVRTSRKRVARLMRARQLWVASAVDSVEQRTLGTAIRSHRTCWTSASTRIVQTLGGWAT